MSLTVKNASGTTEYIKGTGAGSSGDPHILERTVSRLPTSTAALTNVSASASSTTILASNSSRKGATVYNDSTSLVRIKCGATASATSFTDIIDPGQCWSVPFGYTGILDGIWEVADGTARVTEFS